MNNELMVLLGCGLAAYAVTNACTSIYEKAEESDSEDEYEGFSCGGYHEEGYSGCGGNTQTEEMYKVHHDKSKDGDKIIADKFAIDYFQEPVSVAPPAAAAAAPQQVSPLMFGTMVSSEPYIESDYIEMKEYTGNPDGIKVYNEKDDTIGLPVTDMTDVSAGENNKYIYDRTIGTIGFTSTKIGGRFRGQADYIRGDLGIVPNKTGWFQVPSDPANKLMVGAINQSNGIGSSTSSSSGAPKGAGHALGKPKTLDDLIADKDKSGRANAMGGARQEAHEWSAQDIINASILQNKIDYSGINQ